MCWRFATRPIDFEEKENGCLVCISHKPTRYGYFDFSRNGIRQLMHRHIYEEMFGAIPEGLIVRHKCDNRSCINPEHLELGTYLDNNRDKVERGRQTRGVEHHSAKLTEDDVREIKRLISLGMKNIEIFKKFNLNGPSMVSRIKNGHLWTHIK
jgi:hypothetical protein